MASMLMAIAVIAVAYWFFRSPLCCSLADVVRAQGVGDERAGNTHRLAEAVDRLTDEMSAVRADVDELAERLDFAERALTGLRRHEAIAAGRRA